MKSLRKGRQLGWVSVLLALLSLVQAGQQNEEVSDMLHLAPDIYSEGPLKVDLFTVYSDALSGLGCRKGKRFSSGMDVVDTYEVKLANSPPRPLLIAAPREAGEYPLIVLQHAFTMKNTFYSQLLKHVASHGFVAVAPQMYLFSGSDATDEINVAASVINWLPSGLVEAISKRQGNASVKPDLEKLALVGHSRGGKVVFGLATGVGKLSLKVSAVAGLDPVDGLGIGRQTNPPILQFYPHALALKIPTLIVGAGLGSVRRNFLFPPCAPEGVSHEAFFQESASPAFHFVAPEHGHMDYMDDETPGAQGLISYCLCKNGASREPMRRFSAGILVAFLQASLRHDCYQFSAAIRDSSGAPVKLDVPESFGTLSSLDSVGNLPSLVSVGDPRK